MPRRRLSADETEAVRDLYVQWTLSSNPILQSAGADLRRAARFSLTPDERARNGDPWGATSGRT